MEVTPPLKPNLSHFGFWDVNKETLDFERYANFVIIRVMERGTEKDMQEIIRYYGEPKIIEVLTSATSLLLRGITAGKYYFHLKDSDFKCFTKKPSQQNFSMF